MIDYNGDVMKDEERRRNENVWGGVLCAAVVLLHVEEQAHRLRTHCSSLKLGSNIY